MFSIDVIRHYSRFEVQCWLFSWHVISLYIGFYDCRPYAENLPDEEEDTSDTIE